MGFLDPLHAHGIARGNFRYPLFRRNGGVLGSRSERGNRGNIPRNRHAVQQADRQVLVREIQRVRHVVN